jgi:hypothetical protein
MQPQWLRLVGQVRASVRMSDARQVLAHLKLTVGCVRTRSIEQLRASRLTGSEWLSFYLPRLLLDNAAGLSSGGV